MKRTTDFLPHAVKREDRADGTILLTSEYPLGEVTQRTGDWLHHWADAVPEQVFIAERSGAGWREESYAETLGQVRAIAASLLGRGMGPHTPILIMSGNGVDHALITMAAHYIGVPTVPVAEQYSLITGAHGRLKQAIDLVKPAMAYVVDADQYAAALGTDMLDGIEVVASRVGGNAKVTAFDDLLKGVGGVNVDGAFATVTPDTIAKILMTSGSTSAPKGVLTTQRMMCVNQTQLRDVIPFLSMRPPRVVDWLPWSHVFGGSHNFNMMLANGGSYYIDDGKPAPGLFDRTLENLGMVTGSIVFNVPVGFSMLLGALKQDQSLRERFFADLDMLFYAGASLPQDVWEGFEALAMEIKGEVPLMTSSWGLTETAPATMMQQEPTERSGVVGVPMTGVTLKLVPDADMRCEVRVKGPNIMQGYFNAPEQTAAAFDDEGFFITGDAMAFVDPADMNKGMRFDGRISEDFKLQSGTWVRAAALRLDMLAALAPLAADLVVTGQDRSEIGLMIFPNRAALEAEGYTLEQEDGALTCPALLAELTRRLRLCAQEGAGSSTRVVRAVMLAEPQSLTDGEITAKGNLNFRAVLTRRAGLLKRLYEDGATGIATL
ncbi:feruloyl-CoA synthase [uncultured Sulfitobacter sp.]|uniref:feruloyl-CoA synthase n=1 Tax=uncultured Sulfitobacter sp. TaxID=191468 RepID=UPI00262165DF|nr:feruloyl-CoA synthase [uncultured Sulfitobacter sp.]